MTNLRSHRIAEAKWELHKQAIHKLYLEEDKRLEGRGGVIDTMAATYGFSASKSQYEMRFKKWNFRKHSKKDDWLTLSHVLDKRKIEGKDTEVYFDGELVDPNRIRKETTRHRKQKGNHPYSQVEDLASYIRIKTPPPSHAACVSQTRRSSPIPHFSNSSSLAVTGYAHEFASPSCIGISNGSPAAGYQSSPFLSQITTFDILSDLSIDDSFPRNLYGDVFQQALGDTLDLTQSYSFIDSHTMCSTPIDMAIATPVSSSTNMKDIETFPSLFVLTNRMFARILPAVEQLIRKARVSDQILIQYPAEKLYHPRISKLLCTQTFENRLLHLTISCLINNEGVSDRLNDPQTDVDKLFKTGVEYLCSLDADLLGDVIDSIPVPYSMALEQSLFCASVELNVGQGVEAILKRGFNPNKPFNFQGSLCYPLEYSCRKRLVEVTCLLIRFGSDPNKNIYGSPLHNFIHGGGDSADVEIISLLLSHGATLTPDDMLQVAKGFNVEMILWFVDVFANASYEMFISNGALTALLESDILGDRIFPVMRKILEQDYPESVTNGETWNTLLSLCLSNSAWKGQVEMIDYLFMLGARPITESLVNAVRSKNISVFERFVDLGLDPNTIVKLDCRDMYPMKMPTTAICQCVEMGFKEAFQTFKQRGDVSKVGNRKDSFQETLMAACSVGDEDLIDYLLSLSRDTWTKDLQSMLTSAVVKGQEVVVKKLLAANIAPANNAIFFAIQTRQLSIAILLIQLYCFDITPYSVARELDDPLYEAVIWGNITIINELIYAGASLDKQTQLRRTMVTDVCYSNFSQEQVALLDSRLWTVTPLAMAILTRNRKATELLLDSGAEINTNRPFMYDIDYKSHGWLISALAASVFMGHIELVQTLLHRGANPFDNSAIYIAAYFNKQDIAQELLKAFTKRYPRGAKLFGIDALIKAILVGNLQMINLLARSTDPNCFTQTERRFASDWDMTPLCAAIEQDSKCGGNSKVLSILLQTGGDPNKAVRFSRELGTRQTALVYAIELGSLWTVKKLIEAGADLALPARWGVTRTPLQAAVEAGNMEILEYLLQRGAHPNEPPAALAGATSLQLAAIKGFIGIAATLLEANANVNAEPAMIDGRTAFEGATEHGKVEMMHLLFQNGADLLSNNQLQYRRAIRLAEENGQHVAKRIADQLFEAALKSQETRMVGDGDMSGVFGDI